MVVGIDVGGTKTHVLVLDDDGSEEHLVFASDEWRLGGLFGNSGNAARLVDRFAGLVAMPDSTPLALGAHGCDTVGQCRDFAARLAEVYPGPIQVVNDAELLIPAAGLDSGIAVIAGTGSIVVGTDAAGESVFAGGHGWLLGDPGSAPGLVREAVKKVLSAHDEGKRPDALGLALMEHFGVNHEVDLGYAFSASPSLTSWGSAAPVVFEADNCGSPLAARVIDEAAAELADSVRQARLRGALGDDVVCAGAVVTNQPRLFEALRAGIARDSPDLTVHLLRVAPVFGAVAIAQGSHVPSLNSMRRQT